MLIIENCNSLSELRQKLIDGEEVRTARNDLCEEAISRAKALEAIKKLPHAGWLVSTESVLNVLSELSPVTPLEQELCEDWHDVPSDEMTLGQARQAVKDLRKKLAEYLEQEPCEDAVNRQTGIDIIDSWLSCNDYNEAERHIMRAMQSVLYDLPPVNPTKTGHWIKVTNGRGGHECDLCHEYAPSYQNGDEYLTKYCPLCGAKMV